MRKPEYATPAGDLQAGLTTTQGVAITNAQAWHTAGFRGNGVRVAVIDGGFQGYTSLLGADLPSSVVAVNFADSGTVTDGGPHGTACAEIVYDMAPGVTLYLLRINTNLDLQEAVNYAIAQGVHIISTSLGWYNLTPGDGSGFFNNEVIKARNAGIFWTTAAANDRESHWGGLFSDTNNNTYHEFGSTEVNCFGPAPGQCWNLNPGYSFRVFLRWDNWTAPVNQDYDLYLVRWNGSSWDNIASGVNYQNGGTGQTPTEFASATTSGSVTMYGVRIKRFNATRTNVNFELFVPKFVRPSVILNARSLANLADASYAFTVGALTANSPPYAQESYSSEGPTNGPGGTASGGYLKPNIAAFANVNTRSYGTSVFNGTSAATPHVAGAAALVQSALPGYRGGSLGSFLIARAVDGGAIGTDYQLGYGRLWLDAPPTNVGRRARMDFNGDRVSDIFWRKMSGSGFGSNSVWFMNGTSPRSAGIPPVTDAAWSLIAVDDFNGDDRVDLLWRHTGGSLSLWYMDSYIRIGSTNLPYVSDTNWKVVATADFNGDGKAELLWYHTLYRYTAIWYINGSSVTSYSLPTASSSSWKIIGTGDFNGDGKGDVLWRNTTGAISVWMIQGSQIIRSGNLPTVTDLSWEIIGTGDFNGDRRSDILWRKMSGSGINSVAVWTINDLRLVNSYSLGLVSSTDWKIIYDGDFNGDGIADLYLRHATLGYNDVWFTNTTANPTVLALPSITDVTWAIPGNGWLGTGASSSLAEAQDLPLLGANDLVPPGVESLLPPEEAPSDLVPMIATLSDIPEGAEPDTIATPEDLSLVPGPGPMQTFVYLPFVQGN